MIKTCKFERKNTPRSSPRKVYFDIYIYIYMCVCVCVCVFLFDLYKCLSSRLPSSFFFLSVIVIDSKESKGWGTLLYVTDRALKALVSSRKELIEPSSNPSNHLIAKGPKLDGNTLHIKASFFESIAILWLKWLTCSTRFVLPLYMVNIGCVNC